MQQGWLATRARPRGAPLSRKPSALCCLPPSPRAALGLVVQGTPRFLWLPLQPLSAVGLMILILFPALTSFYVFLHAREFFSSIARGF